MKGSLYGGVKPPPHIRGKAETQITGFEGQLLHDIVNKKPPKQAYGR